MMYTRILGLGVLVLGSCSGDLGEAGGAEVSFPDGAGTSAEDGDGGSQSYSTTGGGLSYLPASGGQGLAGTGPLGSGAGGAGAATGGAPPMVGGAGASVVSGGTSTGGSSGWSSSGGGSGGHSATGGTSGSAPTGGTGGLTSGGSGGGLTSGGSSAGGAGGTGSTQGSGATGGEAVGGAAGQSAAGTGATLIDYPQTPGARFPFPQNRPSERCPAPSTVSPNDVIEAYLKWKEDTVTAEGAGDHLRVKRLPSDPPIDGQEGGTVSEGIAYGMLLAVNMNDQPLFDELWLYSQQFLDGHGLMHWFVTASGELRSDPGYLNAATDSDEDMAWALLIADQQWGGQGSLERSYLDYANDQIGAIWASEILDGKLVKPGDEWGDWGVINPSYFAPSYYRVFAEVSGNSGWNDVVDTSYDILESSLNPDNGNADNGLVPAWCDSEGHPVEPWPGGPSHFQYDSCRIPFRIGLDYCQHGEPRAAAYLGKISSFYAGIGASNVVDGYDLDGTPRPQYSGGQSAAFLGPAAVAALSDPAYSSFANEAAAAVATGELLIGGAYYDESWTVLSLLMLTGNFLEYQADAGSG